MSKLTALIFGIRLVFFLVLLLTCVRGLSALVSKEPAKENPDGALLENDPERPNQP